MNAKINSILAVIQKNAYLGYFGEFNEYIFGDGGMGVGGGDWYNEQN